jgi:hypothetical protein
MASPDAACDWDYRPTKYRIPRFLPSVANSVASTSRRIADTRRPLPIQTS